MLSRLALPFLGLICVVLQSNLFLAHYVFPVKPDLSIPFVVAATISRPPVQAFLLALWVGFLMDVFSGGFLGLFVLLRGVMFFLVFFLRKRFFMESPAYACFLVVGLFYFELLLLSALLPLKQHPMPALAHSSPALFWQAVLSLALWYGAQLILVRLEKRGVPAFSQASPWILIKK